MTWQDVDDWGSLLGGEQISINGNLPHKTLSCHFISFHPFYWCKYLQVPCSTIAQSTYSNNNKPLFQSQYSHFPIICTVIIFAYIHNYIQFNFNCLSSSIQMWWLMQSRISFIPLSGPRIQYCVQCVQYTYLHVICSDSLYNKKQKTMFAVCVLIVWETSVLI